MDKNRVFTQEELQEIIIRPVDAAVRAVERRNREELVEWVTKMYNAAVRSFNLRRNWDKGLTDVIYERLGIEGIYDVMQNRDFTEKELEDLLVTPEYVDEIYSLYDAGEYEAASEKIKTMHNMSRKFHDKRIYWETILMSYVYQHCGAEDLKSAMRKIVYTYKPAAMEPTKKGDFVARVKQTAWGLHSHGEPLRIEEDDEKVSIWMEPCGSGQWLVEQGIYESGKAIRIPGQDMSWGLDNFPIYCVHAPIQEMIAIGEMGYPDFVNCPCIELKEDPNWTCANQSCRFAVYKDPKQTPAEVYERLGLKKPDFDT